MAERCGLGDNGFGRGVFFINMVGEFFELGDADDGGLAGGDGVGVLAGEAGEEVIEVGGQRRPEGGERLGGLEEGDGGIGEGWGGGRGGGS